MDLLEQRLGETPVSTDLEAGEIALDLASVDRVCSQATILWQ